MFKYLTQKWKQKRGFTLMEVMVVVAILAVIAGIAIPSVINMRKNMKFTERNDYAKAIFMAAQANLTEMRSKGELSLIIPGESDGKFPVVTQQGSTTAVPPATYFYTWNDHPSIFDCVLPANSIDSAVRNGQIIIEYNPAAGIVYSVFYYDDDDMDLKAKYTSSALTRDEEGRKELLLGYYSVGNIDALDAQALDVRQVSSSLIYTNAENGTITITVPILDEKANNIFPSSVLGETENEYTHLISGLEVALTVSGENTNTTFTTKFKGSEPGVRAKFNQTSSHNSFAIDIIFTLDSLSSASGFTDIVENKNENSNGSTVTLGDNVTITADLTYYPTAKDPIVMIESSTIAGVNPLYHSLTQNPDTAEGVKPYILAISNARHLQNLQHLDGAFADANIESIVFVAQTEEDAVTNSGGTNPEDPSTPSSDPAEPSDGAEKARTAGTPNGNEASESPSTPAENTKIAIDWANAPVENFTPIKFSNFNNGHKLPKIIGNGVEIKNLTISTTGTDTTGSSIGLFSVLKNTSIEGIILTNPTVTNNSAFLTGSNIDNAATTGALIGTAEGVTVKECCVSSSSDASYISGNQFVGGLVGLVKGNSTFEDCTANVTVKNVSSAVESTDNLPHILGGLVGYVEGSTATGSTPIAFTNCTTTATVTATTATDLGGMAGKAVNASFTGCSTEATVIGADGVLSNIGGLVGEASNVSFTNCDSDCEDSGKDGAIILSGPNAGDSDHKQQVGGLVGLATGGNFTNCTSNTGTEVTSAENALSDIGGMVGYAHGTTFTTCKSYATVHGTAIPNSTAIPNNNLGGFVGKSENSNYANTIVELNYQPTYAKDAGGFAGILKNGLIDDLCVTINVPTTEDNAAGTVENFGAIASQVSGISTNENKDIEITITGTLDNAKNLAGAFYSLGTSEVENIFVDIPGVLSGKDTTSGFAIYNEAGGKIKNSYVTGSIAISNAAGFVYQNNGTITSCIANTVLPGGNVFVADNYTPVKNCYGWAWNDGGKVDLKIDNMCSYSYFVNGSTDEMVMYEGLTDSASTKSTNILDTDALTDPWALELLNANETDATKCAWEKSNTSYPYPKLKGMSHVGDHKAPVIGDYPYVLEYIENGTEYVTMEYEANGTLKDVSGSLGTPPSSDSNIEYYLYHRTDDAFKSYGTALSRTDNEALYKDVPRLYTIYKLDSNESFTIDGISFNTRYPLYDETGTYRIRTAQQFQNLNNVSSGTYCVEVNLNLKDITLDSFGGTLKAINDATITASKSLVNNLTGRLSGLTVTGLKAPMVNEISGGTVTGCDVSGEIKSGENVGIIAGTLSSGSIEDCVVSGSVTGSGYVGGVVGRSAGTIKDVTATLESVSSSDTNKTGALVGYASAGTIQNCNASVSNATIPPFVTLTPKESIDKDAQYFSRTNHIPSNSDDNITRLYLGNSLSWAPIDEANFATYSSDVTISGCKLNNTSIPAGFVYYYKMDENLQCSTPSKAMDFIVMDERDPQFDAVATNETQYYIHVSDDTYKAINNVHIEDRTVTTGEGESQKEETIHDV